MEVNINPFSSENPMTIKDAAIVASVAALAVWILTFLVNASVGQIRADPEAFLFDAVKTYLAAWAGNFIALAGLEQLVTKIRTESESDAGT